MSTSGTMEEAYLWFTRDPCGVVCMLLTHMILIFSNYTITSCLVNWSTLGFWRFLIIAGFQILAILAALAHLKCAFGDPGAVPLPSTQENVVPGSAGRELQHPGALTSEPRTSNETPRAHAFTSRRSCAPRGFVALLTAVFCPLQVVKNFIGSKRIPSSTTREEEAFEEGWAPPVCRHCVVPKPLRAHHCSGCKRCIIRMDHHCPWINNCVGFLNQKYFMLFLMYVNFMCCAAFVVLVCRVVTCVDTSAADGFEEAATGHPWMSSRGRLSPSIYDPIPSSDAEYHPAPDAQLSAAAARKQWNAVHNLQMGVREPAGAQVPDDPGIRRRLATVEDIRNSILYAAQDPITRWMHPRGLGGAAEQRAAADGSPLSGAAYGGDAPQTPFEGYRHRTPRRHFLMTFMFSFIFGLFTIVMFFDQLSSILSNTTGIEALKKVKNEKKSAYQLLKEVFGGPFGCYWFLPVPVTSFQLKRFTAELQRFPGAPENEAAPEANGPSVASVRSAYESGTSSVPLATRRGRSPHNSEEGYSEGPALFPAAGEAGFEGMHPQALFDADRDQQVSLEDTLQWAADAQGEDAQEPTSSSVFTSPILRQPRPLINPGVAGPHTDRHSGSPVAEARATTGAAPAPAGPTTPGAAGAEVHNLFQTEQPP